jgi:hypothetical protein
MDGAASGGQLLFLDGVFGIVGMVRDVGWDAEIFDFGSGDIWGFVGKHLVAGGGAVGRDETFQVSSGALDWFDEPEPRQEIQRQSQRRPP